LILNIKKVLAFFLLYPFLPLKLYLQTYKPKAGNSQLILVLNGYKIGATENPKPA